MQLRFVPSESTFSYLEALEGYLAQHGRPVARAIVLGPMADEARYSDKHTVFRVVSQTAKSGHGMTQFGRALNELNIEILCANSSQAKGRVERANRTLQDRLVKELRLAGISDMAAANEFLPGFVERYNASFARVPHRPDDLHRPLNVEPDRLRDILCFRDERYVGQQLAFSYQRKRIILKETEITRDLPGKYIDSYEYADGRLDALALIVRLGRVLTQLRDRVRFKEIWIVGADRYRNPDAVSPPDARSVIKGPDTGPGATAPARRPSRGAADRPLLGRSRHRRRHRRHRPPEPRQIGPLRPVSVSDKRAGTANGYGLRLPARSSG